MPGRRPEAAALDSLADACRRTERGLLVAGPAGPRPGASEAPGGNEIAELSRLTGWPLIADLASQLRSEAGEGDPPAWGPPADLATDPGVWRRLRPDLVLQWGRAPTATGWVQRLTDSPLPAAHWVVSGSGTWHDPESTATDLLMANPAEVLAGLLERLRRAPAPAARARSPWRLAWQRLARASRTLLADDLAASEGPLSESRAAAAAVAAVPPGGLLTLGNSLSVRQADVHGAAPRPGGHVLSQRGASGIDGLVAGAAGAAVATGRPSLVLLGDVSLLHDVGSLATVPTGEGPFVVVVIDNRGGRIFEQLPVARQVDARRLEHWITPPTRGRDFAHAAAFGDFEHRPANTAEALDRALEEAFSSGGRWLLEARVEPSRAAAERRELMTRWRLEVERGEAEESGD
ncbi:MAG: thiamine pyrophosphate-dependent enzyme, partial [Acidobacteriota bacterium]